MRRVGEVERRPLLAPALLRLALLAVPALAGCGFQPLYASPPKSVAGPAAAGLAETAVGLIPDRPGQLLRQALQERFERNGVSTAQRYDLSVSFGISAAAISIQPDSSNSRMRMIGTATYQLIAQDPGRTTLTTGTARSVDGLDLYDQQLFAMQLEIEVVQQRIAEAVADEITRQLAVYFEKQAAVAAAH
jgi:LPS-assembly lipoprotein